MNEDLSFGIQWARKATLSWFADLPAEHQLLPMPGVTSHLLWQLGHIYVIAENINEAMGFKREHDEAWRDLFCSGSKPREISAEAWPSWEAIMEALATQRDRLISRIEAADKALLNAPNPKPAGHRPETVRGWITHTIRHEAIHCGIMRSMMLYHRAQA